MTEPSKPLNRDEVEALIRHYDREIQGIREGILAGDYNPFSDSAKKDAAALKFYRDQKEKMVNFIKQLDSTDAF